MWASKLIADVALCHSQLTGTCAVSGDLSWVSWVLHYCLRQYLTQLVMMCAGFLAADQRFTSLRHGRGAPQQRRNSDLSCIILHN